MFLLFFWKDRSFLPKGAYDSGGEAFTQWDEVDQFEWQASMASLQFRCLRMEIKMSNLCFCEVGWLFFWSICMWVFIFLLFCEVALWPFIDLHVGVRFFCSFIRWVFALSIDLHVGVHFLAVLCSGSLIFNRFSCGCPPPPCFFSVLSNGLLLSRLICMRVFIFFPFLVMDLRCFDWFGNGNSIVELPKILQLIYLFIFISGVSYYLFICVFA